MENVRAPVPDVGTVPYLPVSAAARDETDAVRDDRCFRQLQRLEANVTRGFAAASKPTTGF
ncbi:hypothetical protein PTKU46_83520 [Paraburkholderia terrae]